MAFGLGGAAVLGLASAMVVLHVRIASLERVLQLQRGHASPLALTRGDEGTSLLLGETASAFRARVHEDGRSDLTMGNGTSAFVVAAPDANGAASITIRSASAEIVVECPKDGDPRIVATSAAGRRLWVYPAEPK